MKGKCVRSSILNEKVIMEIMPDKSWYKKLNSVFDIDAKLGLRYALKPKELKEYENWVDQGRVLDLFKHGCWSYIIFNPDRMLVMVTKSGQHEKLLQELWKKFPIASTKKLGLRQVL